MKYLSTLPSPSRSKKKLRYYYPKIIITIISNIIEKVYLVSVELSRTPQESI